MRILLFAALLLTAVQERVCAQDTTANEWPFQAIQVDFALFPMGYSLALSWSGAVDIDLTVHKHLGGSVSLFGCRLGFSQFDWPYVKFNENLHYSGNDFDLLLRHTYRSSTLRTNIVTGLSIRDADYKRTHKGVTFPPDELLVTAGLKLGGAVTLMLIKPALGLRLKASCRFFGTMPIEGGALGLGLVLGWQREPW